MSYAGNFLRRKGKTATIMKEGSPTAKLTLKRVTKAVYSISIREAMWEGLIQSTSGLISGDVFEVDGDKYITQSVDDDTSGEKFFYAVKSNTTAILQRQVEGTDADLNVTKVWETIESDIPCYVEVVTRALRQYDAGILETTIYIMQASKEVSVIELDRIVLNSGFNDKKCRVDSIDPQGLEGVYKIQLGVDNRP